MPEDSSPVQYEYKIDNQLQFRYETSEQGNGYIGTRAAEDLPWLEGLLKSLQRDGAARTHGHVDTF